MCLTFSTRNPPRTTSLKTTFRLLFKDSKRRTLPNTNRFAVEVGSCGDIRDALDGSLSTVLRAGHGPPAFPPQYVALLGRHSESAPPNQPTVASCELLLHDRNSLGRTASDCWRPVTAAFLAQNGLAATAPRYFSTEPTFGKSTTTVLGWLGKISASTTTDGV